jgi:molybdopterin molybdotransferase
MALEPLADARARVLGSITPLEVVEVPLGDALGAVLGAPVVAGEPVPPFANTAMDGYAVRAADTRGASAASPVELRVAGEVRAGTAGEEPVRPGQAVRIMTGAPVPPGADAIVPVEVTEAGAGDPPVVRILAEARPGDHVRPAGGDLRAGDEVFTAGTVLGPAHIGVLASLDVAAVPVHRRPRVAVVSTGDELVERGPLAPGQIRDSNRPLLRALVAEAGATPVDLGVARDDEADVRARMEAAVDSCDALVTSGGVSVGDYDYVKLVLERLAAERGGGFRWSQVAIKPAKPFAFGTVGGVPVFGLPGNPVSAHVSFELFARPALRRLAGHAHLDRPRIRAVAPGGLARRPDGKLHLDRVRVAGGPAGFTAVRSGVQASNVLSGMAGANGLALVPDGEGVPPGGSVEVMLLGDPLPEG